VYDYDRLLHLTNISNNIGLSLSAATHRA